MTAPPPLIAAEVDLRDYRWLKLDVVRLMNSDFNAGADDTAWRCGVTLWARCWHQVPAGSLPHDDATLCHLAGLGRDLKTWRRVRPLALHGFAPCDDGRLYHPFICEQASEAWAEKQERAARRAADRERKAAGKTENSSEKGGDFRRNDTGIPPENALREEERRGKGRGCHQLG